MAKRGMRIQAKTFYLNEQHELRGEEKEAGGSYPKYAPINWASKGKGLKRSLRTTENAIKDSRDPLRDKRYFMLTKPETDLVTEAVKKHRNSEGKYLEDVEYSKADSLLFERLGLDLLQVNEDGTATVHTSPTGFNRLVSTAESLDQLGKREQYRWAKVHSFDVVPSKLRIDSAWVDTLEPSRGAQSVIELQPLLMRSEVDIIMRAIADLLSQKHGGKLIGSGTDYSGRCWFRGEILPVVLGLIADVFYSVQSLHPPLLSRAATAQDRMAVNVSSEDHFQGTPTRRSMSGYPCVAILDTGVPEEHAILRDYRRASFNAPNSAGKAIGSHGSFVASRVVFGDQNYSMGLPDQQPTGDCEFYDVRVASYDKLIEDKSVVPAMEAVVGGAPDMRVFNLSFDDRPLDLIPPVERQNRLALVQDLDNFIFASDVVVVVSAGNTDHGQVPNRAYPHHADDPNWALGPWARSFNALTCGSFVGKLSPDALVTNLGWPSGFSRVGPGSCRTPKPDFSDHGGNCRRDHTFAPGLGVWGCIETGHWEDRSGTSFAAPLLARQAAFAINRLEQVCLPGTRPFAVTAKAFLTLTAERPVDHPSIKKIRKRTLGRGKCRVDQLDQPKSSSAVMIWQGVLEGPKDLARVKVPIPHRWWERAEEPALRIVFAWDTPVNAAVHDLWACRKVNLRIRTRPDDKALDGSRKGLHVSYPLSDRLYHLKPLPEGVNIDGDIWLAEIDYDVKAAYYPAFDVTPQQRVAFAAELIDFGPSNVSPQAYVQELPIAQTMQRLSILSTPIRTPVIIKSRS